MPLLRSITVPFLIGVLAVAPAQTQSSATLAVVGEDGTSKTLPRPISPPCLKPKFAPGKRTARPSFSGVRRCVSW